MELKLRFSNPIQLTFWFNFILPLILAGKNDTVDEFKVALGNLDLDHSFLNSPVHVTHGQVPLDLEGSFARHGCGVLGIYNISKSLNNFSCYGIILHFFPHTKTLLGNTLDEEDEDVLDRVDHLFDCIEIDQSFSFHKGEAYFNSRFYDTNIAHIFRDIFDQDMSQSSVYFYTIFSR